MPFIPHTPADEQAMLEAIGVTSIADLFDEIPDRLLSGDLDQVPQGVSEMAMMRLMNERARQDEVDLCFLGAGAYEHHIPAAVWDLVGRGEFMTAYTPYQAEASQGTLQLIYEFQTMITRLMQMDVANASVYDGATALAEAVLMAVRANKKITTRRVLVAGDVNPRYVEACQVIVGNQGILLDSVPYNSQTGMIDPDIDIEDVAALVIACPNFFGGLNDVNRLTDRAHAAGALVIGIVNPVALALLKPPGAWGDQGVDIAVAEGQPLGIPLASGGPYLGIMCCRQSIVRQMPGRIIGRTSDLDGKDGFALTLQAREQHIRRGKATSNICTNQGLLVTAASIYLSLLGDAGLRSVAARCHSGIQELIQSATRIEGVSLAFPGPVFHEAVLRMPCHSELVLQGMLQEGILAGLGLEVMGEDMADAILVNVTETKTSADIAHFTDCLTSTLERIGC